MINIYIKSYHIKAKSYGYDLLIDEMGFKYHFINSTINRVELLAMINALELIKEPSSIKVFSWSKYLINNVGMIKKWKNRGWKNLSGSFVKNEDLWRRIDCLSFNHMITYEYRVNEGLNMNHIMGKDNYYEKCIMENDNNK